MITSGDGVLSMIRATNPHFDRSTPQTYGTQVHALAESLAAIHSASTLLEAWTIADFDEDGSTMGVLAVARKKAEAWYGPEEHRLGDEIDDLT